MIKHTRLMWQRNNLMKASLFLFSIAATTNALADDNQINYLYKNTLEVVEFVDPMLVSENIELTIQVKQSEMMNTMIEEIQKEPSKLSFSLIDGGINQRQASHDLTLASLTE